MIRSRIGRAVPVILSVVLSAIVGGAVATSAQETPGNNPFVQILTKLDNISDRLTAEPPPPAPVTLATPALYFSEGHYMTCYVVNVGTENVEVLIEAIDTFGVVLHQDMVVVAPGYTENISLGTQGGRRCEFTFEGSATTVRASLHWLDIPTKVITSVDAR